MKFYIPHFSICNICKDIWGHTSTFDYDELLGLVTEIDGPNSSGDVTTRTYDVFGRLATETRPDGTIDTREYRKVGGSATGIADRSEAVVMVESIVTNGATSDQFAPSRTYLDSFGRTLRTRTVPSKRPDRLRIIAWQGFFKK